MTCIIGIEHEGEVYIGADSAAVAGWAVLETVMPKVFQHDVFLIGYTSSFRMGQLLWQHLDVRAQHGEEEDSTYIICGFVEAVRKCLKGHGYAEIDNNVEEGGCFLVGHRGKLYRISSDYGVFRCADGFDAVGCGGGYALGAMKATASSGGRLPRSRIREALEIAAHFSGGVIAPFTILQLERQEGGTAARLLQGQGKGGERCKSSK